MSATESRQSQTVEVCSSSCNDNQSDSLRRRMITDRDVSTAEEQVVSSVKPVYQASPEQIGIIHPQGPDNSTHRQTFRAQTYSSTKTVAQGFLNISLLSANAGQLKIVLQQGKDSTFYELLLTMIGLSFFLQLLVSYLLASKYMMEMDGYEDEEEQKKAMKHNRWSTFIVTLISAVNVIISTFIGH